MERLEFDLLFRWFVGMGVDDALWDHSTFFSKNCERPPEGDVAAKPLREVLAQPRVKRLLSGTFLDRRHADRGLGVDEELSAKGRLGRPPAPGGGRNRGVDFHGQRHARLDDGSI
jgi:Transposase domain (DUF772)